MLEFYTPITSIKFQGCLPTLKSCAFSYHSPHSIQIDKNTTWKKISPFIDNKNRNMYIHRGCEHSVVLHSYANKKTGDENWHKWLKEFCSAAREWLEEANENVIRPVSGLYGDRFILDWDGDADTVATRWKMNVQKMI